VADNPEALDPDPGSRSAGVAMAYKLIEAAQTRWRAVNAPHLGAVYTEGWDRQVAARGASAKATKHIINTQRIYPPLNGNRDDILAAAAPTLRSRPALDH